MHERVNEMSARSDVDLVSAVMGSDELARRVLDGVGGLRGLGRSGIADLRAVSGVGETKARALLAAVELGVRSTEWPSVHVRVSSSEDVYQALRGRMGLLRQEVLVVLMLNTRNEVVDQVTVSRGGLDGCEVQPRDVLRHAIRGGARRMVIVHNHPSGDCTPSPHDVALTRRLAEASEMVGIPLVDHVVIGNGCYSSLRDLGILRDEPVAAVARAAEVTP